MVYIHAARTCWNFFLVARARNHGAALYLFLWTGIRCVSEERDMEREEELISSFHPALFHPYLYFALVKEVFLKTNR